MEVIKYSDLFSDDISQGIEGLVKQIGSVKTSMESMIEEVKAKAQGLSEALAGTSSSTKGGRDNTQAQAAQAEALYASYNQLKDATKYLSEQMVALTKAEEGNSKIVKALTTSNDQFASVLDRVKAEAELASAALGKIASGGNAAEIKQLTATVKALEGQLKALEKAQAAQGNATNSATRATSSQKAELLSLEQAYSSLSPLIQKTGVDLNALITTQKAHEQVSKNGVTANTSLAGSYNQLAAQYNLIKTALNAMSKEMRESEEVGKVWEARALSIMNKMKAMQEATGKNTLSVGDYGKALNGLNISTQQVLREMPTLANSASQFFIAISNNIPIFIDNFMAAQKALGSFSAAMNATLKVMFSWNTVLLVVLTILPKIAKAIHDKRKATEEDNKETQKQVSLMNLLREAMVAVAKAEVTDVAKLRTLVAITNDHTRSMEDKITAATELKNLYEEQLKNYTAEEIAMGKAKTTIDTITNALLEQAKARALLNKITEAYTKQIDAEDERNQLGASRVYEYGFDNGGNIAGFYQYVQKRIKQGFDEEWLKKNIAFVAKGDQDVWERYEKYKQALKDIETYGKTIDALTKRIPVGGLLGDMADKTKKGKEQVFKELDDIPDYYFEMMQSIVNLTEDELDRELEQFDLDAQKAAVARADQFAKLMELQQDYETRSEDLQVAIGNEKNAEKKAELEEQLRIVTEGLTNILIEQEYMADIMTNEDEASEKARLILLEDIEKRRLEIKRKAVRDEQAEAKAARDKEAYEAYEAGINALDQSKDNTQEEIKLKETLNAALLASEEKYWNDYLTMLRDKGLLTVEEYNKIMEKIAGFNTSKATNTQTSSRRKRGQKQFRNVTEIGFALSSTFGEDVLNEKGEKIGRKIKDEYLDFASAINDAIQTSIDYMDEWMDKRIEMAELAVEKAAEEADAAKTALDYEMQARANGYANNVELARKEYEEKKRIEQEAIAEQKRLQKIQEGINTAQQIGALVTATANLWSGYSEIPIVGPALAIAATALMWGSFLAAKIQAANLANAETHGEGMAEYLDYGGSHASGHDIDFGRTKDGRKRRVEKGEVVGVIRKDKVQKYGVDRVLDIIKSLNNGTYDDHSRVITSEELINNVFGETPESRANLAFLNAKVEDMLRGAESGSMGLKMPFIDKSEGLAANYSSAFDGLKGATDLSLLERGMGELIKQGEVRVVQTAEGRIEYRGNNKRIIRNG